MRNARHRQLDLRWFALWIGVDLLGWTFGVVVQVRDSLTLTLGVGPLYVGIGSYDLDD